MRWSHDEYSSIFECACVCVCASAFVRIREYECMVFLSD